MFQKNVDDGRRTHELGQQTGTLKRFTSMPSLGQLKDGQSGYIVGTNMIIYRDGDKLKKITSVDI